MNIRVGRAVGWATLGDVYYQKRLIDFYFSGCFQWFSTLSVSLAARL